MSSSPTDPTDVVREIEKVSESACKQHIICKPSGPPCDILALRDIALRLAGRVEYMQSQDLRAVCAEYERDNTRLKAEMAELCGADTDLKLGLPGTVE